MIVESSECVSLRAQIKFPGSTMDCSVIAISKEEATIVGDHLEDVPDEFILCFAPRVRRRCKRFRRGVGVIIVRYEQIESNCIQPAIWDCQTKIKEEVADGAE
jgi:hypothetical protein